MGKMFYLIGKSASGKDTIYEEIKKLRPQLKSYIMFTTRPMRDGEGEGEPYHFTTEERLKEFKENGRLIESRTYHTVKGPWIYATVDDGQFSEEKGDFLVSGGTVESYERVRDYFGSDVVMPVYVEVEDGERLIRAIHREQQQEIPKYKEMCRRFIADSEDFSEEKIKRAGITKRYINIDLKKCIEEILETIDREGGR